MYGWMGKILRVDLAREEITKEALPEEMVHKFVGGRGLNVKFLYDELEPGVDPLGPRNKIIIGAGPCNGTIVPGSTRFTVTFKSPLTGFIGDSNSGGTFGVTLKYAGYDMLIIEGKAKRPSYLWIDGDVVELRNGEALIGKTTGETRRELESELTDPDISVVSIGPAGENLVKISCLIGDMGRAAGRCGGGAVFGSKNLKAIAIRGKKGVKVANVRLLEEVWQEMFRAWHDNPSIYENRARFGTGGGILNFQKAGILPTMNYRKGIYERLQDIGPQNLPDRYFIKPKACFSCPVPCQHVHVIGTGLYAGEYGEGLELAHLEHLGSRLLVDNLDLVVKASIDCDEYGLDVMEVGQLIGYAMECFENSILTPEDLGGLEIKWGNAEAAFRLIEMVACRKGIGDLFADGIKTASEKIGKGSETFAHTVKGQAIPSCDPRGSKAWGLGYAVSSRGADHCRAMAKAEGTPGTGFDPATGEMQGDSEKEIDRLTEIGKGRMVKWYEDARAFQNCMEMCILGTHRYPRHLGFMGTLSKFFNAVTGSEVTATDCLRIGERVINMERAFNLREGLSRKDDTLPKRFLKEPMPAGPAEGQTVDLDVMLDEYYEARGWDKETGVPKREKLEELGLSEVIDHLKLYK